MSAADDLDPPGAAPPRSVLGHLPVVVWVVGVDGGIRAVEGAALETVGWKARELEGRSIHDVFSAAPGLLEVFERGRRGAEEVVETELGGRIWRSYFRRLAGAGGQADQLLGVSVDVTGQVRAVEDLALRGSILEAISITARTLMADAGDEAALGKLLEPLARATDASRVYLFENHVGRGGARLTSQRYEWVDQGVTPQIDNPEMLDLPYATPGLDEMGAQLERGEVFARHARTLGPEFRALLERQQVRSILIVPVFAGGGWWGFVGFDECRREREWTRAEVEALRIGANLLGAVLERRRVDRELRESEAKYRDLFENALDLFWTLDSAGRFRSVNRAICAVLGRGREEIEGRSWREVVVGDEQQAVVVRATRAALAEGRDRARYQVRVGRGDGAMLEIEVDARLILEDGRLVGVQGSGRDVTEHQQLEEHLRQAAKMEAVGRLAAEIAHEFDQLVTAISGYGERVLGRLRPGDPLRSEVGEILRAGERAADLTRELLAFGRQQPARPARIDLNELLQQRLPTLRRIVSEEVVVVDLTETPVGRIHADPSLIEQVVVNLFVNARDAMPEGGRIELSTAIVDAEEIVRRGIAHVAQPRYVRLSIRDTGHGYTPAIAARLFEPFFSTRERGRGSGLGLSIVYSIVKQCDGYVFVDSHPGQGSVFHIYFPQTEASAPRRPSGELRLATGTGAPAGDAREERILVVEDEDLIRNLAEQILTDRGYRVLTAASAIEALEVAGRLDRPLDLLLTDIVMPGLSGIDLAQRLQRRDPRLRVLYMSGYSDSPLLRAGLTREGAAFLQKPFSPAALERRVRELLDGRIGRVPGTV